MHARNGSFNNTKPMISDREWNVEKNNLFFLSVIQQYEQLQTVMSVVFSFFVFFVIEIISGYVVKIIFNYHLWFGINA
jgi:hypothetical protein